MEWCSSLHHPCTQASWKTRLIKIFPKNKSCLHAFYIAWSKKCQRSLRTHLNIMNTHAKPSPINSAVCSLGGTCKNIHHMLKFQKKILKIVASGKYPKQFPRELSAAPLTIGTFTGARTKQGVLGFLRRSSGSGRSVLSCRQQQKLKTK